VSAVLDRPDPVGVKLARPVQRGEVPGILGLDRALPDERAERAVDGGQRVRVLVRVRADHGHPSRPFTESCR
jgi:hypothetical protein